MLQNLVLAGLTPLCNTNEIKNWDNMPFNGKWPENQRKSVRGSEAQKPIRKKPKRIRTAYSTEQIRALEKIYAATKYIDAKRRKQLAETLHIGDKALKIWFQNRRMKEKKETSESSCDSSSDTVLSCQSPISNECVEQKVDANLPCPNYSVPYEPDQYQFPYFYYQDGGAQYYQNGYCYEPNAGSDTCVYPTEYYPVDNQYNNVDINAYSQSLNAYGMDSWYGKTYDYSYYNTQQV